MRYRVFVCALSVFAAFGCGAAEDGENVGESQDALTLVSNKILRVNAGGKCIEKSSFLWKRVDCTYPYPASKKFVFEGDSGPTGPLNVKLANGGTCLIPRLPIHSGDTLIGSAICPGGLDSKWQVLPGSGSLAQNTFQLRNALYTNYCIHASSDDYMRVEPCVNTFPAADAQRLLLDDF